jgi:hypothetical protein
MALNLRKFSKSRRLCDGTQTVEVRGDVVKWLHDTVGNLRSVEERSFLFQYSAVHYKGEGWEITPPRSLHNGLTQYELTIDDDALAVQFKLLWL